MIESMNPNSQGSVKFGKYVLLERIATGGMAELFKAKLTGAEGFEKLIVIKRILHHLNSEEKLVESFIDEAKLAARLHHPNIVQLYDFGAINDRYFISMEYLAGKDLRFTFKRLVEKNRFIDDSIVLNIISQILAGLDYSHSLNDEDGRHLKIIHRDIGPQNIFITYDGQVKIIDFGIAKAANQNSNTMIGTIKGKVSYMSPEQASGDVIDHRSDIFATGIVLYELLTLRKIYDGDTFQALAKARNAVFEPAETHNPGIPEGLVQILNKALEKNPDQRYQTADSMLKDLDRFMEERSIRLSQKDLAKFMKNLFGSEGGEGLTQTNLNVSAGRRFEDEDMSTAIREDDSGFTREYVPKRPRRISTFRKAVYGLCFFAVIALFAVSYGDRGKVRVEKILRSFIPEPAMTESAIVGEKIKPGIMDLNMKRYKEAADFFEIKRNEKPLWKEYIDPHYSKALAGLGETLMASDMDQARATLETSYSLDRKNSHTCFLLGKVFTVMKNNEKAVEYYEKAAALDPSNPDIYFNMGYSYAARSEYGKAREMYQKVIEYSPSYTDQAYFNLAVIEDKLGMNGEAVEHMKKALAINPLNVNASRFLEKKSR